MISIITPYYNAKATLAACIESVLVQSFSDWELILVGDGGTDGSDDVAAHYCGQDPRIRRYSADGTGVSTARNMGLDKAEGKFITFLDADDRLSPGYLEALVSLMAEKGADIAGCGFLKFTEPSDIVTAQTEDDTAKHVLTAGSDEFISNHILRSDTRIWSKLFRKGAIKGVHFRKGLTIGEDMMFLLECMDNCSVIAETDEKLYYYYVNPKGAMLRPFTESSFDQVKCWEKAEKWIRKHRPALMEDRDTAAKLAAAECVSIMLVAGKIAFLDDEARAQLADKTAELGNKLKACSAVHGVARYLPGGYLVKILLFRNSPERYYTMYRKHKG